MSIVLKKRGGPPPGYTNETFKIAAIAVHGDEYIYDLVEYVNNRKYIIIICREHGKFPVIPRDHLHGYKCKQCARRPGYTNTTYKAAAIAVHGEEYIYDLVEYVNNRSHVIIICRIHGKFEMIAYNHLIGNKCKKCVIGPRHTNAEYIARVSIIHNNFYDYSLTVYKGHNMKIIIKCPLHGEFTLVSQYHVRGSGCQSCFVRTPYTKESFANKSSIIHANKYTYDKTIWVNVTTSVIITCPIHGDFEQIPHSHMKGHACSKCVNKTEGILSKILEFHNYIFTYQFRPLWCLSIEFNRSLSFDFMLHEYNIIIELDGCQHFSQISNWTSPEFVAKRDVYKMKKALANGYSIIRLLQKDLLYKRIETETRLLEIADQKYDPPIVIYLDNNDEYKNHKKLFELDNIEIIDHELDDDDTIEYNIEDDPINDNNENIDDDSDA